MASLRRKLSCASSLLVAAAISWAGPAWAFPPYRTTDADVADPGVAEVRLGLVKVEREHSENEYFSPLVRVNLGLGHDLEIVSELEYSQDEGVRPREPIPMPAMVPEGDARRSRERDASSLGGPVRWRE